MTIPSSEPRKKIVVFPASGWQGRSVCRYLSEVPEYEVIGIVRNPDSPKMDMGGIDLKKLNIKLEKGDFKDPEGYREHLKGAYGLFFNTDFWSIYGENGANQPEAIKTEVVYATKLIDEAKAAGIKHVIYSSLFGAVKWDEKSYISASQKNNDYLRASGLPYTIYYAAGYWENLEHLGMVKKQDDGSIHFNFFCPDATKQQFTSISTNGVFIKEIFQNKDRFLGKEVLNAAENMTWGDIATRLSALSGMKITTPNYSDEVWYSDAMKKPMGAFWDIFDNIYRTCKPAYIPGTSGKEVMPDLPGFEEWAKKDGFMSKMLDLKA